MIKLISIFKLILTLTVTLLISTELNAKKALLSISSSNFEIYQNTEIESLDQSMKELSNKLVDSIDFTGKICYAAEYQDFLDCTKYFDNINRYWIVLIDNYDVYYDLYKNIVNSPLKKSTNIEACIFNKDKINIKNEIYLESSNKNKDNNDNDEYDENKDKVMKILRKKKYAYNSITNQRILESVNKNIQNLNNVKEVTKISESLEDFKSSSSDTQEIFPNLPVFLLDTTDFSLLAEKYNAYNEEENIFTTITYIRLIPIGQKNLSLLITLIKILIFSVVYFTWKHLRNKYPDDVISIQSFLETLLGLVLIKEITTLYFLIKSDDNSNTISTEYYILTIVYTLECISRTFICFIILLISIGVGIFRQYLARNELKKVVFLFIFIYLFFCIDQILDSYFGEPIIGSLDFKDLKSILFITVLYYFCVMNCIKSVRILKIKLSEVIYFAPEYITSIAFKIWLMKAHIFSIVFSYSSIVFIIIFVKTVLFYYVNLQIMIVLSDFSFDIVLILLAFVFRPRKLPLHFSVSFDLNEEVEFKPVNLFLGKLNKKLFFKNESIVLNKLSNSEIKEFNKIFEMPVAVLNPCKSEYNSNQIMDRVVIGIRKK